MAKLEKDWENVLSGLCAKLNVDSDAAQKAIDAFLEIQNNYSLDGDPLHWMACALYVACRTSVTPTVEIGKAVESNCVSLTRLLRLCNISLIQFFVKIKNWMEMASLPIEFKDKMTHLEHKFAVSTVLFRKYRPIFEEVFIGLKNEPQKKNLKSRKQKLPKLCNTNGLFELTWCLYICVKAEFNTAADDLVDMYHILLSCIDFIFGNVFMANRFDMLNPDFKGLPPNCQDELFKLPKNAPCIIPTLCKIKEGLVLEATTIKEYSWKPVINSFFRKGILKGNKNQYGVLDIGFYDVNLRSLNNLYETYVLSVGEFDERIFLGDHASEQIGTKNKVSVEEMSQVIENFGPSGRACPDTPLTGRRYLGRCEQQLTPVSRAANSLARLSAYLRSAEPRPSATLLALFAECGVSEDTIKSNIVNPCNRWVELLCDAMQESNCSKETIAFRSDMIVSLHYRVFEHIIKEEHRKKPHVSLQTLLAQDTYQLSLFACCTEIVLHAYGVHSLRFPRVLVMYSLSAFHFYKIIELVVQALVDKLSRDVIKHLNAVEEEVLESLVWASSSPLWDKLANSAVPASVDCYLHESPRHIDAFQSPMMLDKNIPPINQAKKQLFKENSKPSQPILAPPSLPNKEPALGKIPLANGHTTPNTTPKKNNSLNLFFRKFYSLAVVRMNDMFARLRLGDEAVRARMWACVEHSLAAHTHLLRDRHLDQLLMCAVYITCKVLNNANNPVERTFAEIMRCYRQRPLADSHVYRSVLIKPATEDSPAERSDLINFYNKVYVQYMQSFALQFTGKNKAECSLSPLPTERGAGGGAVSPGGRRVPGRAHLYVKPLVSPPPHAIHLTYKFSRSPAKDLHAINSLVSHEVVGVKREAGGVAGDEVVKRARPAGGGVARKLHGLVTDRQLL